MKRTNALNLLLLLCCCGGFEKSASAQSLESIYKKQQSESDWLNSCSHWETAQWDDSILYRVKVFPDGRLLKVSRDLDFGKLRERACTGSWGTLGGHKMGTGSYFTKRGEGRKWTIKVEGDDLVSYSVYCQKWKCSDFVARRVLGRRIGAPPLPKSESLELRPW